LKREKTFALSERQNNYTLNKLDLQGLPEELSYSYLNFHLPRLTSKYVDKMQSVDSAGLSEAVTCAGNQISL